MTLSVACTNHFRTACTSYWQSTEQVHGVQPLGAGQHYHVGLPANAPTAKQLPERKELTEAAAADLDSGHEHFSHDAVRIARAGDRNTDAAASQTPPATL